MHCFSSGRLASAQLARGAFCVQNSHRVTFLTERSRPYHGENMQDNQRNKRNSRYSRPRGDRSQRGPSNSSRPNPQNSDSARANYERFLTLAQAEAQSGNVIGAENYYQYAEHYFRMMSSDKH
jgi:hypothetical protein